MKAFRAYFGRCCTDDYATFFTDSLSDAKREAQRYRKAWNIEEKVERIAEVPMVGISKQCDQVKIFMVFGGEGLFVRTFDKDEPISRIYDALKECEKIQDRYDEDNRMDRKGTE